MNNLTKSRRAVALRIAQRLEDEWPNLNMEGYDVDEATDIIEQLIPLSAAEAEAEMEAMRGDDDDAPIEPVVNPTLRAFKDALGVGKMPIIDCIKTATERLGELTHSRDMYRKLFESALSNVDRVFQLCSENPEPILPDFAILGEDKFRAVVRLAEDYKRLRSRLASIREKLEQIVCVKEPDAGVVLLSSDSPMHETIIDGKRYQTYSMDHFSPLGDALIEVWQLTQEQP